MVVGATRRAADDPTRVWTHRGIAFLSIAFALGLVAGAFSIALSPRGARVAGQRVDCEASVISIAWSGSDLGPGHDRTERACEDRAAGGLGIALGLLFATFFCFLFWVLATESVDRRLGVDVPPRDKRGRFRKRTVEGESVGVALASATYVGMFMTVPLAIIALFFDPSPRQIVWLVIAWIASYLVTPIVADQLFARLLEEKKAENAAMALACGLPLVLGLAALIAFD